MATRDHRIAEFISDRAPLPHIVVELLCQDHVGTYVLPYPCRRGDAEWYNVKTNETIQADVLGWREWFGSSVERA